MVLGPGVDRWLDGERAVLGRTTTGNCSRWRSVVTSSRARTRPRIWGSAARASLTVMVVDISRIASRSSECRSGGPSSDDHGARTSPGEMGRVASGRRPPAVRDR